MKTKFLDDRVRIDWSLVNRQLIVFLLTIVAGALGAAACIVGVGGWWGGALATVFIVGTPVAAEIAVWRVTPPEDRR